MNAPLTPVAVQEDGFREEKDGILTYVSTETLRASHSSEWFFDEIRRRDPEKLLVDIRRVGMTAETNRSVVYRRHRELAARRVAILGNSRVQEFLIMFLIAATGHRHSRYFTDEAAARAWLQGGA